MPSWEEGVQSGLGCCPVQIMKRIRWIYKVGMGTGPRNDLASPLAGLCPREVAE